MELSYSESNINLYNPNDYIEKSFTQQNIQLGQNIQLNQNIQLGQNLQLNQNIQNIQNLQNGQLIQQDQNLQLSQQGQNIENGKNDISLNDQLVQNFISKKNEEYNRVSKIFDGNEVLDSEICYGDANAIGEHEQIQNKPHFKRLFSLDLPTEIKIDVQNRILSSKKRTHVITDEMLCALTIKAYVEKGLPFEIYQIYNIFGIDPRRSNVSSLISNCTNRESLLSQEQSAIPIIVIKPKDYIKTIIYEYINQYKINLQNLEKMIFKLEYFADILVAINPSFLNFTPLDVASSIVFFYLNLGSVATKSKKKILSKKIFYSLSGVTKIKFEESLKHVEIMYEVLKKYKPEQIVYIFDYNI